MQRCTERTRIHFIRILKTTLEKHEEDDDDDDDSGWNIAIGSIREALMIIPRPKLMFILIVFVYVGTRRSTRQSMGDRVDITRMPYWGSRYVLERYQVDNGNKNTNDDDVNSYSYIRIQ